MVEEIKAPIPGKILSIKCKVNDFVKSGQVLLILEAMKMENEICSDSPGVVKEIKVKECGVRSCPSDFRYDGPMRRWGGVFASSSGLHFYG